jgi:hypothetical protein
MMKHIQQKMSPLQIEQLGLIVKNREKAIQQLSSMWGIGPFRLLDVDTEELHGKKHAVKLNLLLHRLGPSKLN